MTRVLIIDFDNTGLDMAWRAAEAGHDVKWWLPPHVDHSPVRTGDGFPGIEKVKDWREHMKWAKDGLILNLFNDRKITAELDKWKAFGFPVFGPTMKSAALEIDRGLGMQYFEKFDFPVPPYHTFQTIEETLAFAWKAQDPYVLKPMGDEPDKSLTYVASSPADLVAFLEQKKRHGPKIKGQLMLQEKVDLIMEVGISGWMGKEGFLAPKNVNVEHKKLMNDDYGPSTGEQGCYSADTEVLTDSGWKFWPEVSKADKLATLVDGKLVFEHPSAVVQYDCQGTMVSWKNRSLDILVTPNHNMYVYSQRAARSGGEEYEFVLAEDCTQSHYAVKRTAGWEGYSPDTFTFRGNSWHNGMGQRTTPDIQVPFNDYCKLLGVYIADGSCRPGAINIADSNPEKANKIEAMLSATAFAPRTKRWHNALNVYMAQLARVLKPLGRSYEKRVPDYIKNARKTDIEAFLDAYAMGDGHVDAKGCRFFYTSNPGLADDVQELLLRIGHLGIIKKLKTREKPSSIDGRVIHQRRPAYVVYDRGRKIRSWLDARDRKVVPYQGKVYCATVSSHVLFVRRNGKPVWCGNTLCKYFTNTTDSQLVEALMKFEEPLVKMGHTGDFDIGGAIDTKGRFVPFEVSARMGWPSTFILFHCHRGDPMDWMKAALSGDDTLEVDERPAIGVVMAKPPYPSKNEHPADSVGSLVSGVEEVWDHVSPVELMIETGPVMKDGKVARGPVYKTTGDYVCCVTAQGSDVHDAIAKAYGAVERIKYQDRMVRTDIGKGLEKKIPQAQSLGFNELPDY